jgi:Undecaprenyl-phosphate glucose phosphotransferase
VLYRYSEVLRTGLLISDLLLVGAAWMAAYLIRFHAPGLPEPPVAEVPDVARYAQVLPVILPIWLLLFRSRGLYQARRARSVGDEAWRIVVATGLGVLLLVSIGFFARTYDYSRLVILIFAGLSSTSVMASRGVGRQVLRELRRRGYNLRYMVIVGAGELARDVIDRLRSHPEAGIRLLGVVADDTTQRAVAGVPIRSPLGQLREFLAEQRRLGHRVDQVVIALSREESHQLEKVMAALNDETASVQLVPDLRHVLTLRSTVEDLEGLPVIGLRQSPFEGMAAVYKRCFDLAVAGAVLVVLSPLLALLAAATKLSSPGPVFYRQERMGLDGRVFWMLKFRTMRTDAESESGPVWTQAGDPRRTRLGRLLRRTSLDELPQLWNVLRGEMSIVGPRPERPVFIEQFRHEIPGYMLRHKVKAGMTGWAQVHGWRGNTSLHERIEHDIHYIQNWSIGLDVKILFLTIAHVLRPRNAY